MTIEEVISEGIGLGIPFPDIYDWTMGEINTYITAVREREREQAKVNAHLLFRTASLVARMVNNTRRGTVFKVQDEYKFLYTKEELIQMNIDEHKQKLRIAPQKK